MKATLAPFRNVILLLPSPHRDESLTLLRERLLVEREMDWVYEDFDFLAYWLDEPQNAELADHVIYTRGREIDDIATTLLRDMN